MMGMIACASNRNYRAINGKITDTAGINAIFIS